MSGGQIFGVALAVAAVVYGGLSLEQALTGRLRTFRKATVPPTEERVKVGGWVATVVSACLFLGGLSAAVPGSAGQAIGSCGFALFLIACTAGPVVHRRRLRKVPVRRR